MRANPVQLLTAAVLAGRPLPPPGGDKEDRGRVCVIGGSAQVPGAALLAGEAALRAGAGKLQIISVARVAMPLAIAVPEALVLGLGADADGELAEADPQLDAVLQDCGAVLIGPGMRATAFLQSLVGRATTARATVVLDAGALSEVLPAARDGAFVLTPHAGEMAALCGASKEDIQRSPTQHAARMAQHTNSVVVLKGAITHIVDPQGRSWRHEGGVAGLGTSGSGDVLAGIIAGLAARGASALDAALWGVWLHGEAGRQLADSVGSLGFLARELAAVVPGILDRFGAHR